MSSPHRIREKLRGWGLYFYPQNRENLMKKLMKMTLATEKTFKDGCEEYLLDCKARNLREGTLKHYTDTMKQLYKYIPEDTPIEELNATTFREFIVEMRERPEINSQSLNIYARDLKTLMYFFIPCEIIDIVRNKHLRLVIVGSITLDCRNGQVDPMSEAFLQMAVVFSQLELAMIRSRVRSGMANAKAKGIMVGRPQATVDDIPPCFLRHYPSYKAEKLNVSELARVSLLEI